MGCLRPLTQRTTLRQRVRRAAAERVIHLTPAQHPGHPGQERGPGQVNHRGHCRMTTADDHHVATSQVSGLGRL